MKKILSLLFFTVILFQVIISQTVESQGKPIAEIYTDFHYIFNDTTKRNGFNLNRAQLGYKFLPGGNFSSTIIIDVGTTEDLASGSKPRRYAFFREASVNYTRNKLTIAFGMVSTRIFDYQFRYSGKRYLGPEYQAVYGFGSVADLGVVVDYKINDILKIDLSVLNGEGYTNIQVDNSIRTAFGTTITASDHLSFRLYGDIMKPKGILQTTLVVFAGFKNDFFSLSTEASSKSNLDFTKGHDVWGISVAGSVFLNNNSEIFGKYDYFTSAIIPGETQQWDYKADGTYFIGGVQHNFSSHLKMALNYRKLIPYNPDKQHTDAIYLNARFMF